MTNCAKKSEEHSAFQHVGCFNDETALKNRMLTFDTVSPENFSQFHLHHPQNEANFFFPNIVKPTMFTPDFRKDGKM